MKKSKKYQRRFKVGDRVMELDDLTRSNYVVSTYLKKTRYFGDCARTEVEEMVILGNELVYPAYKLFPFSEPIQRLASRIKALENPPKKKKEKWF